MTGSLRARRGAGQLESSQSKKLHTETRHTCTHATDTTATINGRDKEASKWRPHFPRKSEGEDERAQRNELRFPDVSNHESALVKSGELKKGQVWEEKADVKIKTAEICGFVQKHS